ncbi:MAG TPA: histidine kinase, partial [Candidatus Limnocylindrales bacterium]|nr:histidine kinase [Candidatus Limnocylindrales bacterium]
MAGAQSSPRSPLLPSLARHPLLVDAAIAVGLTAVAVITIAGGARDFGRVDPLGVVLVLLQTLPLVARRLAPVPVFAVSMSALVAQALLAGESFSSSLGALVALFTVAERCDRRTAALAALAAGGGITAVLLVRVGIPAGLSGLTQSLLTVFVVWLVGTWAQERRRYIGTVEERAARAERERELRAAAAVAEERERIARELHDVVTHHVSVIVIQAGAGLRALERRPDDARTALEAVEASGRRALADMRRMLGILGPSAQPAPSPTGPPSSAPLDASPPPFAPMPGLDRLGELLEQVRTTGQRVELTVSGAPRQLDPGLELSAYRIVQEALTNILKHAPGGHATVAIR